MKKAVLPGTAFLIASQKQKSRGAPSGSPTALISQLMLRWQQANPSYEVSPPPAGFRKDCAEHYTFSNGMLLYQAFRHLSTKRWKLGSCEVKKLGETGIVRLAFS
jgi:hypothetical protein